MSLEGPAPLSKANDTFGCALLLETIAGADSRDCVTIKKEKYDFVSGLDDMDVSKITIGVAKEFFDGVDESVDKVLHGAIRKLESAGAKLKEISIPNIKYSLPIYYLIVYGEFASAMQKFEGYKYGHREQDSTLSETMADNRAVFGDEVKRRIMFGTYITMKEYRGKWYTTALKGREAIKADFSRAMKEVDFIISPTNPSPAFKIGEKIQDPVAMYLSDILTVSVNLTGLPAGVVPATLTPLPIGMQIIGKYGEDGRVLQLMRAYEKITGGVA
jgi:aspartyl-tRNA(Asn)/glutamyl-tRNA(Gln) amidotransferase subunit A